MRIVGNKNWNSAASTPEEAMRRGSQAGRHDELLGHSRFPA